MKNQVRSRSGRQIYGQKTQNIEGEVDSNDSFHSAASESGDGRRSASIESTEIARVSDTQPGNTIPIPIPIPTSGVAAAPPTATETNNIVQPPITGNITGSRLLCHFMYQAALEGDWQFAEVLLGMDPALARVEITEKGDRALHVAVAIKHTKFVQKLVEQMSPSDLKLQDGQGQTACCYAAISGDVEIADVLLKKNPNLIFESDFVGLTPLYKAAFRGKAKMVSYFLKSIEVEHLSKQIWFFVLRVSVRSKMYDVALEILEKDGSLAIMRDDDDGTALHMLARQDKSDDSTTKKSILLKSLFGVDVVLNDFTRKGKMQSDLRLSLADKLWAEILRHEQEASVDELIKEPSIIHDAAQIGNVELITMLIHTYPDLIWDIDSNGYTIFHTAVIHRQENVFKLIHQIGAMKDFIALSQDGDGNNILHLAAKLEPLNRRKIVSQSALQMHKELAWFKKVEAIVPPFCLEMRNDKGQTPRELFSEQHEDLFEKSEEWMRNTAESCMLIATILLTVVFAAAFTPPGGNDSETGIPILLKKTPTPFAFFVIFEGIALFGSIFSIIMFWSIMTSSFEEDQFLEILPFQLKLGLSGLLVSLIGAISAFISAYFLVFVVKSARLVNSFIALAYFSLVIVICCKIASIRAGITSRPSRRLFKFRLDPYRKTEIHAPGIV